MALTTPNMGLTAWDQGTDIYSHTQLAQNFETIDQHDHSPGKGVLIPTAGIANGAITTAKLADGAVTNIKIANNAVDSSKILDGSITGADLAAATITLANLGSDVIQLVPTGIVVPFAASSPPTGWLLCDGSAISRTTYATLFTLIGTTYGAGNGTTTFNIPDVQTRIPVGKGISGATTLNQNDGVAAGSRGLSHSHTVNAHSHTVNSHSHTVNSHSHTVNSHTHAISSDGTHHHQFHDDANVAQDIWTRRHTTSSTPDVVVYTGGNASIGLEALYVVGKTSTGTSGISVPMLDAGTHSHSGASGATAPATDSQAPGTSSTAPGTDSQSPGTSSSIPLPYIVFNYIIKV